MQKKSSDAFNNTLGELVKQASMEDVLAAVANFADVREDMTLNDLRESIEEAWQKRFQYEGCLLPETSEIK